MPNKQITDNNYRYAFQGQEKDPETGMEAFELRLWDSRIGRWLTTDPYLEFFSPYIGMGNNPIVYIDDDGGKIKPALGIDMARYNRYIAQLQANFPEMYNYLENHPAIITITFKKSLGNPNLRGLTTVTYNRTIASERDLKARTYMRALDGYPIGVFDFEYFDKDYKGVVTRGKDGKVIRTVSLPEARDLFESKNGLNASIRDISVDIREDATFSTFGHELGHAEFALQNPFLNWIWSKMIEGVWHNPSPQGDGHFPGNLSGIRAHEMSSKVKSECNCDN